MEKLLAKLLGDKLLEKILNPLVKKWSGAIARAVLIYLGGKLVEKGYLASGDLTQLVEALAPLVGGVLWTLWAKHKDAILQNTLAALHGTTVQATKELIKDGIAAPATVPEHQPPYLVQKPA